VKWILKMPEVRLAICKRTRCHNVEKRLVSLHIVLGINVLSIPSLNTCNLHCRCIFSWPRPFINAYKYYVRVIFACILFLNTKLNTQYVINDFEVNTFVCLNLCPTWFFTFFFEKGRYCYLGIFNWLLADLWSTFRRHDEIWHACLGGGLGKDECFGWI
jgi:hypothetical protein